VNIAEFYDGDPRRRPSDEVALGDAWTRSDDPHATFRASWIEATGEVFLVREPHPGGLFARYLDELRIDQADVDDLVVTVAGIVPTRSDLDRVTAGWADAMTGTDSVGWLQAAVTAG
jgi:hypothetical protein